MLKKFKKLLCPAFVLTVFSAVNVFAEPQAQEASPAQMVASFIPMIVILAVFYFLLIRPQRKKDKALREMIANLKVGDTVASIGGIHGKIIKIKDDMFVLETGLGANKSYISMDRNAISRLVKEGNAKTKDVEPLPDDPADETEAEDKE